MIRIFRQIRRKLIEEGSVKSYIKYAFGETVLVVLGILIALQINNWNQDRINDRALKEYLVKIDVHTQEDMKVLDTMILYRSQLADLCKKARHHILNKTDKEQIILLMSCGAVFADFYFKPQTGGYEALKNSPYFGKINNTPLDDLLAEYHGIVEEIAENEKSYNEYMIKQEAHLSTQFDKSLILASAFVPQDSLANYPIPPNEYFETFGAYTSMPSYRNVIGLAAFQFDAMVDQYKKLKGVGQKVIQAIEDRVEIN